MCAGRRSWRGLTDGTDNSFLAATGELPLSDRAWDVLLPRWDGYVMLLLPHEGAHTAAGTRKADAQAAEARALTAVSDCLKCAACCPSCSPCLVYGRITGRCHWYRFISLAPCVAPALQQPSSLKVKACCVRG